MKGFLILIAIAVCCSSMQIFQTHSIIDKTKLKTFKIYKQTVIPQKIFAAEIHYSRIPYQYWDHRMQMVKGMGFNALSVYVMWNFHEIEKGKFDYENPQKNLKGFLDLAKKHGLMVLIRPGPYICSQWDFGGFPARLLSIKDLKIRTNTKIFLDQVRLYFQSLAQIFKAYSASNDGTIVMLQIQNEYGYFGKDKTYIQALRDMWKDLGVKDIPNYYVDNVNKIDICHWQGANIGINGAVRQQDWVKARQVEPNGYIIGGQIYSGWFTLWSQNWQGKTLQKFTQEFDFLMTNNHSFSMYMAQGGTNFGLTAGASFIENKPYDYRGIITSYDFNAAINQQGSPTQKYHAFRELALKHATWQIPPVPASINTIEIKPFVPAKYADFLGNLPEPTLKGVNQLVAFEDERLKMWNQGFVVYSTGLVLGNYEINITVHDFALVYLNGNLIAMLDRTQKTNNTLAFLGSRYWNNLVIIVEAMGHINGHLMQTDKKGIIDLNAFYTSHGKTQSKMLSASDFSWDIIKVPIDQNMLNWKNRSDNGKFPHLFKYVLTLDETGDTYLNMENWKKGYVFVNGYNLGRYWNKGPQQRLFLPGVWLKKGENEVVVLQLLTDSAKFIKGEHTLMTGDEVIEEKSQRREFR